MWEKPFTAGLNFIVDFLHMFTNDERVLFFSISCIVVLLTVIAYNMSLQFDVNALKYILCSDYLLFSFVALKQSPAISFGVIATILLPGKICV